MTTPSHLLVKKCNNLQKKSLLLNNQVLKFSTCNSFVLNVQNQPLYTPGTDPYFLKLFYLLDTQQYSFYNFLRTSWHSLALVLTLSWQKINSHKNIWTFWHARYTNTQDTFFGEQAYLQLVKEATSSSRDFPTPDKRSWALELQNTSNKCELSTVKFICSCERT